MIKSVRTGGKNDNEIRFLTFGTGKRPFVILPGLSMVSVLENAGHHENAYSLFGETHTVYLFDRPAVLREGIGMEEIADLIAEGMRKAGISDADVLGVSMGGMIALWIASKYPSLIHRMVLASSSLEVGSREGLKEWICLSRNAPGNEMAECMLRAIQGPSVPDFEIKRRAGHFRDWPEAERLRFRIQAEACLRFDGRVPAAGVSCPALVIGAAGDRVCPVKMWLELAAAVQGESYLYPSDYGHAVYTEAEDFRPRVLSYLLRDDRNANRFDDARLVWTAGSERELDHTPIFDLYSRKEISADGFEGDYVALRAPDWVMIVPALDDSFVMVRQWRHGMRGMTVEFPGGVCEKGEAPLICAIRELQEETGFTAGKWKMLGSCNPNPAFQENRVSIFLAEELRPFEGARPDEDERISVLRIPKEEVFAGFASGDYRHALTGTALFLYSRSLSDGEAMSAGSPDPISGVHHVALRCPNRERYDACRDFYRELIGCESYREWDTGCMLRVGGVSVELLLTDGPDEPENHRWDHLAFRTDRLNEALSRLSARGYHPFRGPEDVVLPCEKPFPIRVAFLYGPNGEEIELFEER